MVIMNKGRFEALERSRIASNLHWALNDGTWRTKRPEEWHRAISDWEAKEEIAKKEFDERQVLLERDSDQISQIEAEIRSAISRGDLSVSAPPQDLKEVVETVTKLELPLIKHLQTHYEDLHKIPWDVMEHLVAEFYAREGWSDVRLVGRDSATGADIFVSSGEHLEHPQRYFIEVKQWQKKIGIEVIHQVAGAFFLERPKYEWQRAIIVAPGGFRKFTNYDHQFLRTFGIDLKDRETLVKLLDGYIPSKSGLWLPKPLTLMPIFKPNNTNPTDS